MKALEGHQQCMKTPGNNLGVKCSGGTSHQQLPQLLRIVLLQRNSNLADFLDGKGNSATEAADNNLGVHSILHVGLALAQKLAGQENNTGCAITDL